LKLPSLNIIAQRIPKIHILATQHKIQHTAYNSMLLFFVVVVVVVVVVILIILLVVVVLVLCACSWCLIVG
jgi:hypothetical protein